MPAHARRHDLISTKRLAGVDHVDQRIEIDRKRNRAAQRDAILAKSAEHRVLDVEAEGKQIRLGMDVPHDASRRVFRLELAVEEQPARDICPDDGVIEPALLELQQAGEIFVDDADIDHAGARESLPLHTPNQRPVRRNIARRERQPAVSRVGVEDDARSPFPFAQAVWPRSDRTRADIAAGRVDHFACSRADETDHVLDVGIILLA